MRMLRACIHAGKKDRCMHSWGLVPHQHPQAPQRVHACACTDHACMQRTCRLHCAPEAVAGGGVAAAQQHLIVIASRRLRQRLEVRQEVHEHLRRSWWQHRRLAAHITTYSSTMLHDRSMSHFLAAGPSSPSRISMHAPQLHHLPWLTALTSMAPRMAPASSAPERAKKSAASSSPSSQRPRQYAGLRCALIWPKQAMATKKEKAKP